MRMWLINADESIEQMVEVMLRPISSVGADVQELPMRGTPSVESVPPPPASEPPAATTTAKRRIPKPPKAKSGKADVNLRTAGDPTHSWNHIDGSSAECLKCGMERLTLEKGIYRFTSREGVTHERGAFGGPTPRCDEGLLRKRRAGGER